MPGNTVIRLIEVPQEQRVQIIQAVDALFFDASNTQAFSSDEEKSAFREVWLGRYIRNHPEHFYIATSDIGDVLGYLAGSPDNPAETALFSDIDYFKLFEKECVQYPAQLHINIAPSARGLGVGRALIDAYATQCAQDGVSGCHVVTRVGADNVGFYLACGFHEVARAHWAARDRDLILLGKIINRT